MAQPQDILAACWPGREQQIAQLRGWLGSPCASHVVVHGPSGTGKTRLVRSCLEAWNRRFAYVALPGELKLKQLMGTVLSQLLGQKRRREAGWGAGAAADCWNSFAEELARACPPSQRPYSFIVLDNMEWHAHKHWLNQMLAAIKCHRASVAVVVICQCAPSDVQYGAATGVGLPRLAHVPFPAYDRDQLVAALAACLPTGFGTDAGDTYGAAGPQQHQQAQRRPLQQPGPGAAPAAAGGGAGPMGADADEAAASATAQPSPELYQGFLLACVVTPFCALTRSVADLQVLASWLWPTFSLPLQGPKPQVDPKSPAEQIMRRLAAPLTHRELYKALLQHYRPGMRDGVDECLRAAAATSGGASTSAAAVPGSARDGGAELLLLNLGTAAKLLLLAAFIASRNRPTLDKEMFDFKAPRRRGRGKGGDHQEADRQAEAAKEARLKGPHAFPLTRLIHIFHRLWASAASLEEEARRLGGPSHGEPAGLRYGQQGPHGRGGAVTGGAYGGGGDSADLLAAAGALELDADLDLDVATGFLGGRCGTAAVWSQSGQVLSTVASLQAVGLLMPGGGTASEDPLDQPRYCCAIDEQLALSLAADVRINLNNYLMYDK